MGICRIPSQSNTVYPRLCLLYLIGFISAISLPIGCYERTAMKLDRSKPFVVQIGRGSGRDGLETITIDTDGSVVLFRQRIETKGGDSEHRWERGAMKLTQASLSEIADAINQKNILVLNSNYINEKIYDGNQWILKIQQDSIQKRIYCSNDFPDSIVELANTIDTLLQQNGLHDVEWKQVLGEQAGSHDPRSANRKG
jgi:hypothetical protein